MNYFMGLALNEITKMEIMREDWKDRIFTEWGESMSLPRKKKKEVRKRLLLEWRFANYDPIAEFLNE